MRLVPRFIPVAAVLWLTALVSGSMASVDTPTVPQASGNQSAGAPVAKLEDGIPITDPCRHQGMRYVPPTGCEAATISHLVSAQHAGGMADHDSTHGGPQWTPDRRADGSPGREVPVESPGAGAGGSTARGVRGRASLDRLQVPPRAKTRKASATGAIRWAASSRNGARAMSGTFSSRCIADGIRWSITRHFAAVARLRTIRPPTVALPTRATR